MWENVLIGFTNFFEPMNLAVAVAGTAIGILFGSLPGFTATMGVAVFVPVSYFLTPQAALLLLSGIYCGAIYGGSVSAVLLGIPGTPASMPTTFDGYYLTKQGEAGKALHYSTFGSAMGGFLSSIALLIGAPVLAIFALKVGPPETMMLAFFGLSVVCMLTAENMVKGVLVGFLSLILATVGQDPIEGFPRYTYGVHEMIGGVPLVPVLIGIFSLPEIFLMIEGGAQNTVCLSVGSIWIRAGDLVKHWWVTLKSAVIGIIIGIIPAAGPDIGSFICYNEAKRSSKEPEKFGKGSPEGIIASEAGNNGVTGGSLIPLLTLSIPGSAPAAIFLGALYIHGLRPGPNLFTKHADITYTMLVGFMVIQILMYFIGLAFCKGACSVVKTPRSALAPMVVVLTVIGSYACDTTMFDVWVMLISGLIGYVMVKNDLPLSPIALGLILGPMLEQALQQSLIMFHGNILLVFTRPIAVLFFLFGVISLSWPFVYKWRQSRKVAAANE